MTRRWTAAAGLAFVALGFAASIAFAQGPEPGDPAAGPPGSASASNGSPPARGSSDPPTAPGSAQPPPAGPAPSASGSSATPHASSDGPADGKPPPTGTAGPDTGTLPRTTTPTCVPRLEVTGAEDGDEPRLRYTLEAIELRGNKRTRPRVILRYLKLRAGDILDVDDPELELLRYRLLGTGLFQSVSLSLRKGSERGQVVLVLEVEERNTIVVSDLWMGLSADADTEGNARPLTAYAGADVAETNLAGTGITLGGGMGFAQDQLALRMRFFDPAFLGTSWMTSATLLYNDALEFYGNRDVRYDDPSNAIELVQDYAVVRYRRFGGTVGVGRDVSLPVQIWVDYRLERLDATLPLAASHRRGLDVEPIDFGLNRELSVLSTVRGTLRYDTRNSPILPTKGWNVALAGDVALTPTGSDYAYQKLTLSVSRWYELPWRHVVRVGAFGGAIAGYAPIYERFYVGDFSDLLPSRMLDLNTDRRPAPNLLGTDIVEIRYGDYAAKVLGEYRIPLYRGRRSVYGIDLFGAAGIYGVASERDLKDPPRGYSGMAKIPVDLTFNMGLQIDTNAGGFTFAFSNVLGFLPVRSEARP